MAEEGRKLEREVRAVERHLVLEAAVRKNSKVHRFVYNVGIRLQQYDLGIAQSPLLRPRANQFSGEIKASSTSPRRCSLSHNLLELTFTINVYHSTDHITCTGRREILCQSQVK